MTYRDPQTALRALYQTATVQGGYFTAKQAAAAGYGNRDVDYHVKAGNFERIEHGLFRLPTIPISEHDEFIRLSLWSRGRDDQPRAVVSHESALTLHDLGDLIPRKVHITIPNSFRKDPPKNCTLHHADLAASDSTEWTGFKVTTPLRTLLDAAQSDSVPTEQLHNAVATALERGLVRRTQLAAAAKHSERLADALHAVK